MRLTPTDKVRFETPRYKKLKMECTLGQVQLTDQFNMNQAIETVDINSAEIWDSLGSELKGQTVLEKPRVSKKVMIKAIRMQAAAMKSMSQEFGNMTRQLVSMEKEFGDMRALNGNLQRRTMELEKSLNFANASIEVLQEKVAVNAKKNNSY